MSSWRVTAGLSSSAYSGGGGGRATHAGFDASSASSSCGAYAAAASLPSSCLQPINTNVRNNEHTTRSGGGFGSGMRGTTTTTTTSGKPPRASARPPPPPPHQQQQQQQGATTASGYPFRTPLGASELHMQRFLDRLDRRRTALLDEIVSLQQCSTTTTNNINTSTSTTKSPPTIGKHTLSPSSVSKIGNDNIKKDNSNAKTCDNEVVVVRVWKTLGQLAGDIHMCREIHGQVTKSSLHVLTALQNVRLQGGRIPLPEEESATRPAAGPRTTHRIGHHRDRHAKRHRQRDGEEDEILSPSPIAVSSQATAEEVKKIGPSSTTVTTSQQMGCDFQMIGV